LSFNGYDLQVAKLLRVTGVAKRCMDSSVDITKCLVPSRQVS
jgi:hypothetical protein